ncbi:recombinase family protein [Streptomyces europaeiscabiei]|uniref:recombinase family protein n=1 Tax=Streptomyces europaeiscabiei TaxID=146819 RepID=UPI0029BCEFD6|nr:recombinase family protein [Streptomyces europaeiscabiei]MDX2527094.1 recombinase family protein [Streptomyces europaeiscabiei]MDX3776593.1 recombinase family protein [Streptomyces europaeiscabiei]
MELAGEIRSSGVAATLVVHEHKRLGRGIELAMLAEELKASDVGLEFLTGELKGLHDPSGIVFTVLAAMSGMEREYIRDRTLEGHESARNRGKTIGGAGVTDEDMLSGVSGYRQFLFGYSKRRQLHQMRIHAGTRIGLCGGVNRAAIPWSWAPASPVTIAVDRVLSPLSQGADLRVLGRFA